MVNSASAQGNSVSAQGGGGGWDLGNLISGSYSEGVDEVGRLGSLSNASDVLDGGIGRGGGGGHANPASVPRVDGRVGEGLGLNSSLRNQVCPNRV